MEIIRYYESDRQEHWLAELAKCKWRAGVFLHELLSKGTFFRTLGEKSDVMLLTDGDALVSFCTYAEKDDIQPTELTPWIGFVYTFPKYRGHHYAGLLFSEIEQLARNDHIPEIYISTNHTGLYEKYGYEYRTQMRCMDGDMSRIYAKKLQ